jgi:hypothetical protein
MQPTAVLRVRKAPILFFLVCSALTFPRSVVNADEGPIWRMVEGPDLGGSFWGVSALSGHDAWAVGYQADRSALTAHWDGAQWSIVPSAQKGPGVNILTSVASMSSTDVWAVGAYYPAATLVGRTLIEHWNGTTWTVLPSPNDGSGDQQLRDVVALAKNDVWAVGVATRCASCPTRTLVEHWDGNQWTLVPTIKLGTPAGLLGLAAKSVDRLWAVGYAGAASLVERWNGRRWRLVESPNDRSGRNQLWSATVVPGSRQVWAVGLTVDDTDGPDPNLRPLIERWHPKRARWSIVSSPDPGDGSEGALLSIASASRRGLWSVGYSVDSTGSHALRVHRGMSGWNVVPGPAGGRLIDMASVPGTSQLWAVGDATIEHCCS